MGRSEAQAAGRGPGVLGPGARRRGDCHRSPGTAAELGGRGVCVVSPRARTGERRSGHRLFENSIRSVLRPWLSNRTTCWEGQSRGDRPRAVGAARRREEEGRGPLRFRIMKFRANGHISRKHVLVLRSCFARAAGDRCVSPKRISQKRSA